MLESGFFENQVWGALRKAWKGYMIAKNKDEYDKMARIIQESQHDLGLEVTSFDNIGRQQRAFYGKLYRKITILKKQKHHMKNIKPTDMNKRDLVMMMSIVKIFRLVIYTYI